MSPIKRRLVFLFPGDHRAALKRALDACTKENGGRLIGEPSITLAGADTELEVDESTWWRDYVRVHRKDLISG